MLILLLLVILRPVLVHSACLGVSECSCESLSDGSGQVINCRNRDLTAVPNFDLTGSQTQYAELTLAGNRIGSIPQRAFDGLHFRRLDLSDNPLARLDPAAFGGVEQDLIELRLTLSPDAEFPAAAISSLTRLRILHVANFGGRQLPTGAISTLTELVELALTSGSLTTLNAGDLNAQRGSLLTLLLHGNEISAVPTAALSAATMLRKLDLSRNQIQSLPADVFAGSVHLNVVDLSNNGLGAGVVDSAAFRWVADGLRTLTMKSCQLGDGDLAALRQLHAISELTLSYNSFANLPTDLFNRMRALRRLRIDNNRLQSVTRSTFSGASSTLELLDVSHNPLSSVPGNAFLDLNYLQELRLDGVTSIRLGSDSFSSRQQRVLRTLSVRGSGVGDRLWSIISNLKGLTTLSASNCSISSIPDFAFRRNTALQTIDISSNAIDSLTQKSVYGLADSLAAINLHSNRISTIHQCTFYGFSSSFDYFKLGLGANPLQCDCSIRWLYELLRSADSFQLSALSWKCDTGRRFTDLVDADFAPCTPPSPSSCSVVVPPSDTEFDNSTSGSGRLQLILQAHNLSDTACLLEWTVVGDTTDTTGFTITRAVVQGSTPAVSITLPVTARQHRLTGLRPSTEYTVCIRMTHRTASTVGNHACTSVWTNQASGSPEEDEYRRRLTIILASIFGGTILIAVVAIVAVLIYRWRARRPRKDVPNVGLAAAQNRTTRPQVGYGSKRYVRDRGAADAVQTPRTASTTVERPASDAFTPDERARILAMLAATSVAGGPAPRGFSNVAYERGSSELFATEPNGNIYDAIPDDQFDNVPLDSPV